jgi:hypothetical protein
MLWPKAWAELFDDSELAGIVGDKKGWREERQVPQLNFQVLSTLGR